MLSFVNFFFSRMFSCYLEQVLEGVVVLVQPRIPDGHNEVKEGLESGLLFNQRSVSSLLTIDQ